MVLREAYQALTRPSLPTLQVQKFPIPTGGVNAVSSFSGLKQNECHYCYNILPTEQGMKTRRGTKEYANDVGFQIRTMIPFNGRKADRTDDKLYATGNDGIYEVGTGGAGSAVKRFSFATSNATAGYGNHIYWVAANGDPFILYADAVNGLIMYTGTTNTWAVVTNITGLDETKVRFVVQHKLRIWLILEDDSNAYYLGANANSGAATQFQLGSKFKNGGDLAGIFNLTVDAGDGIDDLFLAISRAGDILAFQGTDPSSANTWGLKGQWQVGEVPAGRKFAEEMSGDVIVLSSFGVSSVNDLLQGSEPFENYSSPMNKISNLVRERMVDEISTAGWEIMLYPTDGSLVIQSPERVGKADRYLHYVYNMNTKAWGFWRDVKSLSMCTWRGDLYYGDVNGEVWQMTGTYDNVTIASPGSNQTAVEFSLLTAFSDAGAPGIVKRCSVIKPFFYGTDLSSYQTKVLYDYDFTELTSAGTTTPTTASVWNTARWNTTGIWVGDRADNKPFDSLGAGMGVVMAIALRGRAEGKVTLMEMNITYDRGNYL